MSKTQQSKLQANNSSSSGSSTKDLSLHMNKTAPAAASVGVPKKSILPNIDVGQQKGQSIKKGNKTVTINDTPTQLTMQTQLFSSNPPSRASTPSSSILYSPWRLKFAYDENQIFIPEKILFKDFKCVIPAPNLDLRGWFVNKALFSTMGSKCKPNVRSLRLDNTTGLMRDYLECIRGFPNLRILSLRSTITIDPLMAQIIGSFRVLAELDISDCRVDIKSFTTICQTSQNLKVMTCQNCPGLDDFCMQALAACMQRFRKLEKLDFSRGLDFSDEGFLVMIGATPKLILSLNVSGCKNLTSLALAGVRQKLPALTNLDLSGMIVGQSVFEWIKGGKVPETARKQRSKKLMGEDIANG